MDRFQKEAESGLRSLYLLDVRTPDEFESGHVCGSLSAPGGQRVQQTGQWVGTRNARIVLIDDADGVRAAITASWLNRIDRGEVYVLTNALDESLAPGPDAEKLIAPLPRITAVDPATLNDILADGRATVIDLDSGLAYEAGHVPGAHFALRSRLATGSCPVRAGSC